MSRMYGRGLWEMKKDKHIIFRVDAQTKQMAKDDAKRNKLTMSKYILALIRNHHNAKLK